MNDNDRADLNVVCHACHGDGRIPVPRAAIIGGVPQTVITAKACRWCDGNGIREGLHPPV